MVRRTISVGNHVVITFQVGLYNLLCISTLCCAMKLPRRHVLKGGFQAFPVIMESHTAFSKIWPHFCRNRSLHPQAVIC